MRLIFAVLWLQVLCGVGMSATIEVPKDVSTIQAAIQSASTRDTVLVAPGTYYENIDFLGKAITVTSSEGAESTVINGNLWTNVVIFQNGEGLDSVISGFTITNGDGGSILYAGGGIACVYASPTIRDNIISGNKAEAGGGGIFFWGSPHILDNVIENNWLWGSITHGGGIYGGGVSGKPVIRNNIVRNNYCLWAGGICSWNGEPLIEGNVIEDNSGMGLCLSETDALVVSNVIRNNEGCGIGCQEGSAYLVNNLVHGNTGLYYQFGGGVFCKWGPAVTLVNNTLYDNSAPNGPGGIYCDPNTHLEMVNTIIHGNDGVEISLEGDAVADIRFSDVEGGMAAVEVDPNATLNWGAGNIDADPLFANPAHGDYHLQQDPCQPGVANPCVDSGDPASTLIESSTRTDSVPDQGVLDMGYHYRILRVPDHFSSVQAGIDEALPGEAVFVAPGTYAENIDFLGKPILVTGTGGAPVTVLDGYQAGSVVTFRNKESSRTVLNGFTVTNGQSTRGGGIWCYEASPKLTNLVIRNNTANSGGGVECRDSISTRILNCTVLENTAYEGGGLRLVNADAFVVNSIIRNNSATLGPQIEGSGQVTHSNIEGGYPGTGNIDSDPLFADPAQDDYHLTFPSPCKDTGNNAAAAQEDFEGDPRIAYGTVDMGADEFHPHLYHLGDATPAGAIELKFVGLPGDAINGMIVGVNVFDPPLVCDYGLWYMDNPFLIMTGLGILPAEGVLVMPGVIPPTPPAPYTVYLQAAIDSWLTNLCVVEVN